MMSYYHDERIILEEALNTYGPEMQIMQTVEEMAELMQALSKNNRGFESNIPEEIADVEIMLEQMKLHFRCHAEVNRYKSQKMTRLCRRVDERKRGVSNAKKEMH